MNKYVLARSRPAVDVLAVFFALVISASALGSDVALSIGLKDTIELPPEIASAIQRDLGMTPSEYKDSLRFEHEATTLIAEADRTFGKHYAGGWIERDQDGVPRVVVATSSLAATQAAADRMGIGRHAKDVELRAVRFSLNQLDQTVEAFNLAAESPVARKLDGIHSWGIDLSSNRVVVVVSPGVSDEALDFFADSNIDLDILDFVVSEHEPSTLVDIVGGFRYNGCSIGFSVRRGSTPGFATAGHCGSVGTLVRIGGVAVGHFQRSDFPGADAAWANVRSSDTLWNLVWRYSGNTTYAVTGSSEAPLGATVCRSGFRTGWRCGSLTRNNVTVNYPQGQVHGLRESNACAGQGDSGGSWVAAANQAQGVTSGGALGSDGTNCGIPQSQRRTWFQRLNPMLSAYGLNLVTN